MRLSPALACLALALPAPLAPASLHTAAFQDSRELEAEAWLNHIGEPLTLANLRGRAVLIQVLRTTEDREKPHWFLPKKFQFEYGDAGLVVMGATDESPTAAAAYLREHALDFPVAAGCNARSLFNEDSPFALILLDPKGEVFWRGPANGLWNGKLVKGMKGNKRVGDRRTLILHLPEAESSKLKKVVEYAAKGDLEKALDRARDVAADERADEPTRAEAATQVAAIEAHVELVFAQIDDFVERRELTPPIAALEVWAGEFKRDPIGERAAARLQEIREDPDLEVELEAEDLYQTLYAMFWRKGLGNVQERLQKLRDEFRQTRAATKAYLILSGEF